MTSTASRRTIYAYLIFWVGQVLSSLGSSVVQFVLLWWIVIEYSSPAFLSLAYLVGIGVQVIFMPIAGVFVDRWNRKIIIGASEILQAIGAFALIILFSRSSFFSPLNFYLLVLVFLGFRGIVASFHATAAKAIIPIMIPENQRDRMNSLSFIVFGFINITGIGIGAVLYELYPIGLIIWIDCISFLFALGMLFFVTIPPIVNNLISHPAHSKNAFIREFRDGINIIRSRKGLIQLLFVITLINFLQMPIVVLGPIFINTVHGGSAQDVAMIVVSIQIGLLLAGTLLLLRKEWKRKTLMIVIAIYVQFLGYLIQTLTPIGQFWIMAIGAFIFGAMLSIINTMFRSILQLVIPPELQGRVTATSAAVTGACIPLGVVLSGVLSELGLGYVPLFLGSIILGLIVLTCLWLYTDLRFLDQYKELRIVQESIPNPEALTIQN